jgi:hypothetical protein
MAWKLDGRPSPDIEWQCDDERQEQAPIAAISLNYGLDFCGPVWPVFIGRSL